MTTCHESLAETVNEASLQPDQACRGRLPVSAQAHAGTCGQSADRRHSLRACMVTVTRSAYVQVSNIEPS